MFLYNPPVLKFFPTKRKLLATGISKFKSTVFKPALTKTIAEFRTLVVSSCNSISISPALPALTVTCSSKTDSVQLKIKYLPEVVWLAPLEL